MEWLTGGSVWVGLGCGGPGDAGLQSLDVDCSITVLFLNIRGFVSHHIELEAYARIQGLPGIIGMTETLLDPSTEKYIAEYALVSRLGRRVVNTKGGGIALFAREDVASHIVHVGDSEKFERSWFILHADLGPILLGLWYRPPAYREIASVLALGDEYRSISHMSFATIIVGDLNVHQVQWLRHSSHNSPEGHALQAFCADYGFSEHVRQPTRGKH